jgi:dihydroflavonol-4-reductase
MARRAVRFARNAGVKRLVMTSSVAAICYGRRSQTHFTEADWSDISAPDCYAYPKSKTIAERAARDWVAAEGGALEYCSVNPALVLGPLLAPDFSMSLEAVKKLVEGSMHGLPDIGFGIVDVRGVADLHIRCLTAPDMAGERFIASGPFMKLVDIAAVLKQELGAQAHKVPTRKLPSWLVRLFARFDPVVGQIVDELGFVRDSSAAHAQAKLGWRTRPARDPIVDTALSLIDHGVVRV